MKAYITALIALFAIISYQPVSAAEDAKKAAPTNLAASGSDTLAELYEHLADSIIDIRSTEDNLVKGLLIQYHATAQRQLAEAEKGGNRKSSLEGAAASIGDIANEGDKKVRAIRQRLSEAGHYHQKDTETAEDFMFINSKEKKALLAVARKVGQLGADAAPGDIKKVSDELKTLFGQAIGRE